MVVLFDHILTANREADSATLHLEYFVRDFLVALMMMLDSLSL